MDELYYQGTHSGPEIDALLDTVDAGVTPVVGKGINILDNWYFVGGGGAGAFPINQRGQSVYTGAGYGIDRWYLQGGVTLTVNSGSVTASGAASVEEKIQNVQPGTYTLSVLYDKSVGSTMGYISGTGVGVSLALPNGIKTLASTTFTISSEVDLSIAWYGAGDTNSSITLYAVKLELGSLQTLARQVNGVWELNDTPPDYGLELWKCMRYQQPCGDPLVEVLNSTTVSASFKFYPPLRATPTEITPRSNLTIYENGDHVFTISSVSGLYGPEGVAFINMTGTFDTAPSPGLYKAPSINYLFASANL